MATAGHFEPLTIVEEELGDTCVLRPEGYLIFDTAPRLRERLDAVMGAQTDTVLELSTVDFIDSSGVALLLKAQLKARRHGWRLQLRAPSSEVRRVLEVSGLGEFLNVSG